MDKRKTRLTRCRSVMTLSRRKRDIICLEKVDLETDKTDYNPKARVVRFMPEKLKSSNSERDARVADADFSP